MRMIAALTLSATLMAQSAAALPPLNTVKEIDDGLLAVALADEFRKRCDDISPRMVRALSYLRSLKNKARAMGYSDDQIDAYVSSKAEKARMRARGVAWLSARGVKSSDTAALCALARAEVAQSSTIGQLLKAK